MNKDNKPMECDVFRSHIEAYIDGELIGEAGALFRAHVEACESCRAELALFRSLRQEKGAIAAPPAGFRQSLEKRIQRYESLGLGKEDVYLPGVRFHATDDVSFLRHARYVLLKNYYRRKIFRVLGEYFPNRAAASLVEAVHKYRQELSRKEGRRVYFREALLRWKETAFEDWKEYWKRPAEDEDFRLSTRIHRRLQRVPEWLKMAVVLVPFALFIWWFIPSGTEELRIAHHFRGSLRTDFEYFVRKQASGSGVSVRFFALGEEALVHVLHYQGAQSVRNLKPDLLVMDMNMLSLFRSGSPSDGSPAITRLFLFDPGDRPAAAAGNGDELSRFGFFSAVVCGRDGRFPKDARVALRRFHRYLKMFRNRSGINFTPLYRTAGLMRLSGRVSNFVTGLTASLRGRFSGTGVKDLEAGRYNRLRILRDPEMYRKWRLAFPEFVIYGLLNIREGNTDRIFLEHFRQAQSPLPSASLN